MKRFEEARFYAWDELDGLLAGWSEDYFGPEVKASVTNDGAPDDWYVLLVGLAPEHRAAFDALFARYGKDADPNADWPENALMPSILPMSVSRSIVSNIIGGPMAVESISGYNGAYFLMGKALYSVGKDYTCRALTNSEWDRLADIVDEDDSKMHWKDMFSWCSDVTKFDSSLRAVRGYYSARYFIWGSSSVRFVYLGFRPAFVPLGAGIPDPGIEDGDSIVVGTLYMAGNPVRVPQNPTWDGDIEDYIPGATLEVREALPDTDYQIHAIKTGDVLIADRNLLKRISWDDLETQGLC